MEDANILAVSQQPVLNNPSLVNNKSLLCVHFAKKETIDNSSHSSKVISLSPSLQEQFLMNMQMNLAVPLYGVTEHKYLLFFCTVSR